MKVDEAKRALAEAVAVLGIYGALTELAAIVRAGKYGAAKMRAAVARSIEKARDAS